MSGKYWQIYIQNILPCIINKVNFLHSRNNYHRIIDKKSLKCMQDSEQSMQCIIPLLYQNTNLFHKYHKHMLFLSRPNYNFHRIINNLFHSSIFNNVLHIQNSENFIGNSFQCIHYNLKTKNNQCSRKGN